MDDEIQKAVWQRHVTPQELLALLDRCPFLQIVAAGGVPHLETPEFIQAKSGWVIHHYGDAMSSSPGVLMLGSRHDDDDEGGGHGTLQRQSFDTAQEMIALAKKLGWPAVKTIDGHPWMVWAAWMKAEDESIPLENYEPTKRDQEKRERVKRSDTEDQLVIRPKL